MKKILSLVLAVAMLSTTAMAATINIGIGGSDVSIPGNTLRAAAENFGVDGKKAVTLDGIDWRLCNEYFTVSAKKFEKGANLVKEVKINDDEKSVDIVLNDNYELVKPAGANLVIKELSLKAKKEHNVDNDDKTFVTGEIKKGQTYTYSGQKEMWVGFDKAQADYEQGLDSDPNFLDGRLVKFVKEDDVAYATATYDEAGDIYLEGRVYDGDKVYVEVNYDVEKEILKSASDDADLRFYNVKTNGFPSATTINLTADEDEFVYKIVDGKLTASGLKWSEDDYAWTGKIRSSVSYVVSDVELKASAVVDGDKPTTDNPDTGANDVVGIAAALAVVSLVAAGAVSLKK